MDSGVVGVVSCVVGDGGVTRVIDNVSGSWQSVIGCPGHPFMGLFHTLLEKS